MDMTKITRFVTKVGLKLYKHRADIAFFGGMGLTAVGTGLFVKSTFKQAEINEVHKNEKSLIKCDSFTGDIDDEKKDELLKENNRETLKATVKNYALPVAVTVAGYGLEIYGHQSVKSDLAIASTALNGMTAAYEAIKARVIASEGEDKWAEYANGVQVYDEFNPEDPNSPMGEKIRFTENYEPHSYLFYEPNPNWNPNKGCNKAFLLGKLNELEYKLKHKGVLFEHEALEALGYELKTELKNGIISPTAGWVYDPDKSGPQISFGFDYDDEATKRFMSEDEPSVMIRFNCVDDIYNYI